MINPFKTQELNQKNQNKTYRESETTMTRKTWNAESIITAIAVAVALPVAFPDAAEAQEACSVYTVKAGDSLGAIAVKFYGNVQKFPIIFEANRNILTSPNTIKVGQRLAIPNLPEV